MTTTIKTISDGTNTVEMYKFLRSAGTGWFEYDQNSPASLTDSYNVSSMTDRTAGDFDANWTNVKISAEYMQYGKALGNDTHFKLSAPAGDGTTMDNYNTFDISASAQQDRRSGGGAMEELA